MGPKEIIEDLLINIGKLKILAEFIIISYDVDYTVPIRLRNLFFAIREELMDVRECILKMRLNNDKVFIIGSHYKYFYMIAVIEVDKYGVEE